LAAAAKIANQFLAAELKKTTEAMKTFTAAGASFAGGLTEMRTVANGSGLNLKAFTEVVRSSRESIAGMGMTVGEAAVQLGQGMQATTTQVGRSGRSLRDEMLAMGYSYEEQGVIMAQYSANMKAGGQLEKMTKEEIAAGTRKYAADLKVLSDITGEDAKKKMEEARKESMRAAIMANMSDDERTKFMQAYASVPKEMQQSVLEYFASGGTAVTNAGGALMRATNKEFDKTLQAMYSGVKDQNLTASQLQDQTLNNVKAIGDEQRKLNREGGAAAAADQAVILGKVGGAAQEYANLANAAASRMYGDADASRKAAEGQATTQDKATQGFAQATDAAMKFSIAMEDLATKALPKYSELLGQALQGMVDTLRKIGVDIPKTEAEIAAEKKKAVEAESARAAEAERKAGSSMAMEGFEIPQYASGGIAEGPKSGHLAMLHGKEAVIPLGDNKVPVSFEPGFAELLSKASMLVSGAGSDATFGSGVTLSKDFNEGIRGLFDRAMSQRGELEKTDEGRAQFAEAMKSMTDTLSSLRQGREGLMTGIAEGRVSGGDGILDTNNRMIELLEQFVSKQDELKREMERSRETQEMITTLL
jgi:hypothetical protein